MNVYKYIQIHTMIEKNMNVSFIFLVIQREMKNKVFDMNSNMMFILFLHKKFIIKNSDKKRFISLIV